MTIADRQFMPVGDTSSSSELRAAWLLAHQAGQWRIEQNHFSPVPVVPPLGS